MTIRALAGWLLVQPLNIQTANEQLRLGKVHHVGELHDDEVMARIPFSEGDRVCWLASATSRATVLNETLLLVPLAEVMAYEPAVNGDTEIGDG
jgi:co-chaperonin GroES (HSP10)